jgi:hypothetical protein
MSIIVGSARIDERGKATGGQPGDQTGREVATQPYYMHELGWYCYRPKRISVANALAEAMLQGCQNNNIGYCQGHRTNVVTNLRKYGTLAKIAVKTEADCSSLVRACCIQVGFDPGNFNTASEGGCLKDSRQFMDRIDVTAKTKLFNGDILVTKSKGHTVIVVSGSPRETQNGSNSAEVDAAKYKDNSLAGTYKTTGDLHLRAGIGKESLAIMPAGSTFQNYGYYNLQGTKKWLYGIYTDKNGNKITGYASSAYLKKQ